MRADVFIASAGEVKSREVAKKLIEAGRVRIDGVIIKKPSYEIDENTEHEIDIEKTFSYVSRGALKLEAALDAFGINPAGFTAVDIGASTGGFTDCLLRRGAKLVYAVDSGHGQLDASLCSDERVVNIEGFNARNLSAGLTGGIPAGVDAVVMDVSFISQTLIIGGLGNILREGGYFVSLIKPQFEAGRAAVGKGGIVRRSEDRQNAVRRVLDFARGCGFGFLGLTVSPITGGDGNIEYLAAFRYKAGGEYPSDEEIKKIIQRSQIPERG